MPHVRGGLGDLEIMTKQQIEAKLHELEVEQESLNEQLIMFDMVENDHEDRKIQNSRRIRRLQAKLARLEAAHG